MKIKNKKIYNPKTLKQIAIDNIKLDDRQSNKEIAKKMINPYYFTDRNLQEGFEINLERHHINHANSNSTTTPNYPEVRIQICYITEIIKKLSVIYARLMNQYKI